jgi:hypothetical protein
MTPPYKHKETDKTDLLFYLKQLQLLLKDVPESGAFDRTVNFGETGDVPLAGRWSP